MRKGYHDKKSSRGAEIYNDFGQPAYSLFTSTKIFTMHHHIDITDANDNIVYQANTKVFTMHDTTRITDADGKQVAEIRRKLFSFHQRHYITMATGEEFELSNEFFHIIKDITNIEGLGWQLRGNILALHFQLLDNMGNIIATIGQKFISMHDKYSVDIYRPEYEAKVIAILVTLQHMIRDRENANAASSGGSSSNGN